MSLLPLRTAVIGFGKIGAGYADDPVMARHYPYATHAQVLAEHPAFAWQAVVDPSDEALSLARKRWHIPHACRDLDELSARFAPEVLVLATPPEGRTDILLRFPRVKAVVVEKPLGRNAQEREAFVAYCAARELLVQVNLWRRSDAFFRKLAETELSRLVGGVQAVFGIYGNGLLNNGTHMVDFARMLFGEIAAVQALGTPDAAYPAGPLRNDLNIPFLLQMQDGPPVVFHPVRFEHYRENGLDIWGEKGRLAILQEGLGIYFFPRRDNRAMRHEREIASDVPQRLESTVGSALYRAYDNLAAALAGQAPLWSPLASARKSEAAVQAIFESLQGRGETVALS